jgi:dihydroxyacid dehydratase/phosphogluconate dehydratase
VSGQTLGEAIAGAEIYAESVIRRVSNPVQPEGGLAVLRGNLAPDGAVIKTGAADRRLLRHTGPAIVFDDYDDLERRIDDPAIPITEDSVLVLKRGGPVGGPGMPEWGMLPIPKRLLEAGVRDMVRISDARMSGTGYGTCVLHVSPEAAVGGPLAFVQDGDLIELDAEHRTLHLSVSDEDMAQRRTVGEPRASQRRSSYGDLFARHVTQAHLGCDFDFVENFVGPLEPVIH